LVAGARGRRLVPDRFDGLFDRGAGNAEQAAERLFEFEDQEDRAGDRERATSAATTLAALRRESIPNPQNSSIAQETTISSSDHDTGLANCSDISNRVCSMIPALTPTVGNRAVCIGVFGLSEAMLTFSDFSSGKYVSSSGGFEAAPAFQTAL
jgi:hypothetical protein